MEIDFEKIEKTRKQRVEEINLAVQNEDYAKLKEISKKMDELLAKDGIKPIKLIREDKDGK